MLPSFRSPQILCCLFPLLLPLAGRSESVIDLSLLVSEDLPATWPSAGWPPYQINHYRRIGPLSAYNSDILTIDGNTGTQLDVPPHSIPRPGSKLPDAGPFGEMFTDKAPAWQFGGEACVIDVRNLLDKGANGRSSLIQKEHIIAWEKQHRPLRFGDVVLFYSGYTDRYYKPFPAGRRFLADPVEGVAPGWPDPAPDAMAYVASRKVMTAATDSPSMGPIPDLAGPTHTAGLKHGMMWTEGATGFNSLPPTGAFYCMLGPKHADCFASEARALAIVGNPLARQLIESATRKRVVDLSVTLADNLPVYWPGSGVGRQSQPYMSVLFAYGADIDSYQRSHIMDSHTGTSLTPPSYALPQQGFDDRSYAPEVRQWLAEYEKRYGPRGTSDVTTDKVPLSQTCGRARVVDVKALVGKTDRKSWPASPEITAAQIQQFESKSAELKAGEIVIFRTGYSDQKCRQPLPANTACMADPLNAKSEGWPAPGPDAIHYLARKGIRCVGTDGPTLGGADPRRALMTYWALGGKGMVAVEYMTNLDKLPEGAYFLFAAIKIRNGHGAPGRAIALY